MLTLLNKSIKNMLEAALRQQHVGLKVSFNTPDEEWRKDRGETVSVFLYDLAEATEYRSHDRIERRSGDGMVHVNTPVARFECRYLVSTWTNKESKDLESEHRLLSDVLWALFQHSSLPREHMDPELREIVDRHDARIPTFAAQSQNPETLGQIWTSLGSTWRPSVHYTAIVPLGVWRDDASHPEVTTKITRTGVIRGKQTKGAQR